jgi:hypothetical protein
MVPTSLIALVLLIAYFPAMIAYFIGWPKRRIMNPFFAVLAGVTALMVVAIILAIVDLRIVWLSWVLLAGAIALVPTSVIMYRRARAISQERQREIDKRRARGG